MPSGRTPRTRLATMPKSGCSESAGEVGTGRAWRGSGGASSTFAGSYRRAVGHGNPAGQDRSEAGRPVRPGLSPLRSKRLIAANATLMKHKFDLKLGREG